MTYIISCNCRGDGEGRWLVRREDEEPQQAVGYDFVQAVDVTFAPSSTYELSRGCLIVARAERVFMDKAAEDIPEHAKRFWLSSEGCFEDWETGQVLERVDQMFLGEKASYLQKTDYPAEGSCVEIVRLGIWANGFKVGDRAEVISNGTLFFHPEGLGQICSDFWTYCRPCKGVEQEVVEEVGATEEKVVAKTVPVVYYGASEVGGTPQQDILSSTIFEGGDQAYTYTRKGKLHLVVNSFTGGEFYEDAVLFFTPDVVEKLGKLYEESQAALKARAEPATPPAPQVPEGFFENPGYQPVPDGTLVEVIFRDGKRSISKAGLTDRRALLQGEYYIVEWESTDYKADILFWRRVTEQELVAMFFPPEAEPAQVQDFEPEDDIPF